MLSVLYWCGKLKPMKQKWLPHLDKETLQLCPKQWSMFFTELAIQNAYFCIHHDMLVTLDYHYISLQFLIYLWFIQQHFKQLSLFYIKWYSG
jgi:hypothetical protein